ncbi:MAG: hypothetical protein ACLTDA_05305 [[Eubacterium] siraeum]
MKNYKSIICIAAAACPLVRCFAASVFTITMHRWTSRRKPLRNCRNGRAGSHGETVPDDTPVSEGEDGCQVSGIVFTRGYGRLDFHCRHDNQLSCDAEQEQSNFYLSTILKEYSDLVPYVQKNGDIVESENLVIYGHHIKGGKMFGR